MAPESAEAPAIRFIVMQMFQCIEGTNCQIAHLNGSNAFLELCIIIINISIYKKRSRQKN